MTQQKKIIKRIKTEVLEIDSASINFFLNGQQVEEKDLNYSLFWRGIHLGEVFFTSFRMCHWRDFDQMIPFEKDHWNRQLLAFKFLFREHPNYLQLKTEIWKSLNLSFFVVKNECKKRSNDCYVRLMLIPKVNSFGSPLQSAFEGFTILAILFEHETKGAVDDAIASARLLPAPMISQRYLPPLVKQSFYFWQALDFRTNKGFEVLYQHQDSLVGGASSNLFLVKNDEVWIPKNLNTVSLEGITARNLKKKIRNSGKFRLCYRPLNLDDLESADEAFTTNCVRGIVSLSDVEISSHQKIFLKKVRPHFWRQILQG